MPGRACNHRETKITYEGGKGNFEKKVVTTVKCPCSRFSPPVSTFVAFVSTHDHDCVHDYCRGCGHSWDKH